MRPSRHLTENAVVNHAKVSLLILHWADRFLATYYACLAYLYRDKKCISTPRKGSYFHLREVMFASADQTEVYYNKSYVSQRPFMFPVGNEKRFFVFKNVCGIKYSRSLEDMIAWNWIIKALAVTDKASRSWSVIVFHGFKERVVYRIDL